MDEGSNEEMVKMEMERRQRIIDFVIKEYNNDAKEFALIVTRRSDNRIEYHHSEHNGYIIYYLRSVVDSLKDAMIMNRVINYLNERLG